MDIKDISKLVTFNIVKGVGTKSGKDFYALSISIIDNDENCLLSEYLCFLSPNQYSNILSLLEKSGKKGE